ncbi:MAG: hypothetical protein QOE90_2278 [Thermoplasmata archaeon]|nr:hypothetical protein [Thermoplasmata archaeon]
MIDAQPRVVLAATLFRVAMPRVASALAPRKPEARTKELLLATLERGVWELPDDALAGYDGTEAWGDEAAQRPAVKVLLERAIMMAVSGQP